MVRGAAVVLAAVCGMEAVSYLSHRFVMHGFGIGLHRSHHQPSDGGFELNDLYPLMFSAVAIGAFAVGAAAKVADLVLVGTGITLYGASYLFVHEIYIHRRPRWAPPRHRALEWMRDMHRIHHLYGGEPYGMLLPWVPRRLRERAAAASWDPLERRRSPGPARVRPEAVTPAGLTSPAEVPGG